MTRKNTNMTTGKKLWIGTALLVLLSPFGLIIPALFGAGGAWGEWGPEEIEKLAGFLPDGMKKVAERRSSPLSEYALPVQGPGLAGRSIGYLAAAMIGVGLTAGAGWIVARLLAGKEKSGGNHDADRRDGGQ